MIISQPYDTHFNEAGLLFGWFFTGKHRPYFKELLTAIYPDKYIFDEGLQKFFYWGEQLDAKEIIDKYDEMYIYFDSRQIGNYDGIINQIANNIRIDTIYTNDKTGDIIFKITKVSEKNHLN